jgi:hypothetical protein
MVRQIFHQLSLQIGLLIAMRLICEVARMWVVADVSIHGGRIYVLAQGLGLPY